jgi:DNA-binding NarL/FixJ family response regulator
LAIRYETVSQPTSLVQLVGSADPQVYVDREVTDRVTIDFGLNFGSQPIKLSASEAEALMVGLIDGNRFSRECLITAIESLDPRLTILPFASVQCCLAERPTGLDLIIYYSRANDISDEMIVPNVATIRQVFPKVRLIVLSEAEDAQLPNTIRSMLKSGAHGFIPAQTTGIQIAIAAIGFVKAGGTFAPLDSLLTNRVDCTVGPPEAARQSALTSRQMAVLEHLRQGKANKIIAHELAMSESTVKVHVRNIMRRMGATNRTQAVYKAQQL